MKALVTGGAGFIGSHLVDRLCSDGNEVIAIDDLSNGLAGNVNANAEFREGSIVDSDFVRDAMDGVTHVFHLGALGSVKRSVDDPCRSDNVNVHGTLTVLEAARRAGARALVSASSSSVYGGADVRPTPETAPLLPRSPYAVTKLAGEHYLRVFAELHGFHTVALRFFNVFGPRQRPDSAYAAVIPRFITSLLNGEAPEVHGDGLQTRDFTYVADVVDALLAASASAPAATAGHAYNVAGGGEYSLIDLLDLLSEILNVDIPPTFTPARQGDVRYSQADASSALRDFGWSTKISIRDGLERTVAWMQERQ